jgi:hypothetical protein
MSCANSEFFRILPLCLTALLPALSGCLRDRPANPAATQPVTVVDPAMADRSYWLNQPASVEVTGTDFDKLWAACEAVAHEYLFQIDQRDYRRGLLKTEPLASKQFFEIWRKDSSTFKDTEESSLGAIRRVIYFQFTRNLDNTYTVTPKVVVERRSSVDPKYYDEAATQGQSLRPGQTLTPSRYWYALRRDTLLESRLADSIQRKLRS